MRHSALTTRSIAPIAECCYAECHGNESCICGGYIIIVVMLSVVRLSVIMLIVIMLSVVMLSVIMLSVVMLTVMTSNKHPSQS